MHGFCTVHCTRAIKSKGGSLMDPTMVFAVKQKSEEDMVWIEQFDALLNSVGREGLVEAYELILEKLQRI